MAVSTALLAGRRIFPTWIGHAFWFVVMIGAFALTVQLNAPAELGETSIAVTDAPAIPAKASPDPAAPAMLRLDRPMRHGDYVWNEEGVPAGRVNILVDISAQTLYVFRSGHEIGRAVILYGTDENPTPLGSFTITQKKADHESNIYDAIMPWMLRLTNDGIAIHGSVVEYGKASRGCVGVPDEFAALLFAQVRLGDHVRIVQSSPLSSTVSTAS